MGKDVRETILKQLYGVTDRKRNIRLPGSIVFEEEDGNTLKLLLKERKYVEGYDGKGGHVNYNMQESGVCFEAWALIIKTYCKEYKKIKLGVKNVEGLYKEWISRKDKNGNTKRNGHVGRFFYRALRFSEQYDWFELDADVAVEVRLFEEQWLNDEKYLCNNIPQGKPSGDEKTTIDENAFERELAKYGVLWRALIGEGDLVFTGEENIYRQLPVGLYEEEPAVKNTVFTGGKSAIDMWTSKGKTIYPIELKYKNEMVGILTEIFFYANYLWDLVREGGFAISVPKKAKEQEEAAASERGYANVKKGLYTDVKALLLADTYHPLVTKEVIGTMNQTKRDISAPISYVKYSYEIDDKNELKLQR